MRTYNIYCKYLFGYGHLFINFLRYEKVIYVITVFQKKCIVYSIVQKAYQSPSKTTFCAAPTAKA